MRAQKIKSHSGKGEIPSCTPCSNGRQKTVGGGRAAEKPQPSRVIDAERPLSKVNAGCRITWCGSSTAHRGKPNFKKSPSRRKIKPKKVRGVSRVSPNQACRQAEQRGGGRDQERAFARTESADICELTSGSIHHSA